MFYGFKSNNIEELNMNMREEMNTPGQKYNVVNTRCCVTENAKVTV